MRELESDELNQQSIAILMDMGYEYNLVVKALKSLRENNKKYNPVGEVQRAVDWINDYGHQYE
jgi:hypothetical protein